jgi:serine protease inhibitor
MIDLSDDNGCLTSAGFPHCMQTPVKAVNSTDPINKWARDKTGGRITQSVPPGTAFDLIITNAVYFRCEAATFAREL